MQQRFIFYFTVSFLMLSAVLMATAFCEGTEPTLYSPPVTRLYLSESNVELSAMPEAIPDTHLETYDPDADQNAILESVPLIPAEVSVFYPTTGQPGYGICWMGLKIDSNDNVYPINGTGFYKILPDGWLVNGVNDENLFASGTNSRWGELDEIGGKLYTVRTNYVRSAAFLEGSEFSNLISFSGISQFGAHHLHIGLGVLADHFNGHPIEFIIVFVEGQIDAVEAALAENGRPPGDRADGADPDLVHRRGTAGHGTDKKENRCDR